MVTRVGTAEVNNELPLFTTALPPPLTHNQRKPVYITVDMNEWARILNTAEKAVRRKRALKDHMRAYDRVRVDNQRLLEENARIMNIILGYIT